MAVILNFSDQIKTGLDKFKSKQISIRSFFAPNHIYDKNTLRALKQSNIKIIIDGYGLFPFFKEEILFIPQLFYKEIILPFGIQSTQVHLNEWKDENFEMFRIFIEKNKNKIINLDYIIKITKPNISQKLINFSVEKTLKTLRLFR